ncbi:MAG: phosphoribosylformylglycinamidine synthase subunit PurQ [Candidatus Dormibacteraceae bacterium]
MKFGVVVFPGTWSDRDFGWVIDRVLGQELRYLWHKDRDLHGVDCVVLPGGFAYGDYLRCGAIARFSPVMESVRDFADHGGLVLGSCNGFQVLCESGLLPGALLRNQEGRFVCQWSHLVCERNDLVFTGLMTVGKPLRIPISHGQGNYFADPATLSRLEQGGQVVFRYSDAEGRVSRSANPNGSVHGIAGLVNAGGNVLGLMPHPERCAEPGLGGTDGLLLFRSLIEAGLGVLTA